MDNNKDIVAYNAQDPISASMVLGNIFFKSRMFGCSSTEQGAVLALYCILNKQDPFKVKRSYHVAENGMLLMRADAMLAEFINLGGKYQWLKDGSNGIATLHVEIDGRVGDVTFTIEDAKRQKIVREGSGWTKAEDAMLRARCTSKAIRMYAPQIVAGVYTPEEAEDTKYSPGADAKLLESNAKIEDVTEESCAAETQKQEANEKTKKRVKEQPKPKETNVEEVVKEQDVEEAVVVDELTPEQKAKSEKIQKIIDIVGVENIDKMKLYLERRKNLKSLNDATDDFLDKIVLHPIKFKQFVMMEV